MCIRDRYVAAKKDNPYSVDAYLKKYTEGKCVQMLHKGAYNTETVSYTHLGFMIQGGGLDAQMKEKACPSIKGEFRSNGVQNDLLHTRGVLSMARTMVKDSASSQFLSLIHIYLIVLIKNVIAIQP